MPRVYACVVRFDGSKLLLVPVYLVLGVPCSCMINDAGCVLVQVLRCIRSSQFAVECVLCGAGHGIVWNLARLCHANVLHVYLRSCTLC
jgi:hypothetical protein